MERDCLLIGELANMFNVTTHTLRFYEKKGLITPSKITEKGYRLYDYNAIFRLEEILLLRSLEMPIETIEEYLNKKNITSYFKQLENIDNLITKKMQALIFTRKKIRASKALVHDYIANHDKLYIKTFKKRNLLFLKEIIDPFNEELCEMVFYKLIKKALGSLNTIASRDLVFLSDKNSTSLYLLIHDIDYDDLKHLNLFVLPEGKYLCGYHYASNENEYRFFMRKVEKHIKREKLKPLSYFIDITSSEFSIFNDRPNVSHLQIPIE